MTARPIYRFDDYGDTCQSKAMSLIIFTGLDGMLLCGNELDYQPIESAVNQLKQNNIPRLSRNYQTTTDKQLQTIGFGCTEQDLTMLETVDIPVIIPTDKGVDPCFSDKDWQVAPSTGTLGWIELVTKICP